MAFSISKITEGARIRGRRWSDNDVHFGPFTYSRDRGSQLEVILSSGCNDRERGANLRLRAFGHTLICEMPSIIQPHREKVKAYGWTAEDIKRMGRDYYIRETERGYGFFCHEGFFNVYFGRQSDDSRTEQRWGYFLPWTQWRHVRQSFYGLAGEHIASLFDADGRSFERAQAIKETQLKERFLFADFDGEMIEARCGIEEREWRFGTGWFRWLSWFSQPKVKRTLDMDFSAEVGKRKGSWKGGTIGHSIEMLPGELHEAAFRRYCAAHHLTFERSVHE